MRFIRRDRTAFLEGTKARLAEADRAVRAAGVEVQTRGRIRDKDRELLASTRARLPGLIASEENARGYFARFSRLAASGDVPVQDRDNRDAAYREAMAKVESLRNEIAAAERQLLASELQLEETGVRLEQSQQARESARAAVGQAEAEQLQPDIRVANLEAVRSQVRQAEAKLRTARVNLSHCLIRAPQGGIISRRTIQLGESLAAKQPFLSIVPLDFDNVWVVANLREDQMDRVRAGNPAVVKLDAIPERSFRRLGRERLGWHRLGFLALPARQCHGQLRPGRPTAACADQVRGARRTTRTGSDPGCRQRSTSTIRTSSARAIECGETGTAGRADVGRAHYNPGRVGRIA